MSDLSEREIFDRLTTSFREAAEHCEALALQEHRIKGQRYVRLREHLHLIEGAARQAAVWREDSRWFAIGQFAAKCHRECGDWLRFRSRGRMFLICAEHMRTMLKVAEHFRDAATGRLGAILPDMPKYQPENRPVQVRSSLIIPEGVTLQ